MNCLDISRAIVAAIFAVTLVAGGCGGSSSSSSDSRGLYQIDLTGGDSLIGTAGSGGSQFRLGKSGGVGDLEIRSRGVARPGFIFRPLVFDAADMGSRVWAASVGLTRIKVATGSFPFPVLNEPYLLAGSSNLYISDNDTTLGEELERVTGVYIPVGATVILELNSVLAGEAAAEISLENDFYLAGTLRTADLSPSQRGHLKLGSANFFSTGTIDVAGSTATSTGGHLEIVAAMEIINQGTITSSGAGGLAGNGGDAGGISFIATNGSIENSGKLIASGGDSGLDTGAGGHGGGISLAASRQIQSFADLVSSGGRGFSGGGNGGFLAVRTDAGGFASGGDLVFSGGALLPAGLPPAQTKGGDGGNVTIDVFGGPITLAGAIDLSGADVSVVSTNGGNGGNLNLSSSPGSTLPVVMAGPITVSGNIDLSGGDSRAGDTAGDAGELLVQLNVQNNPSGDASTAGISFLGYRSVDLSGGSGRGAGNGGNVFLDLLLNPGSLLLGGEIINEAALYTLGGNGDLAGGNGGSITISSMTSASNSADLIADGGDTDPLVTGTIGGAGGDVTVTAVSGFTDTGTISSSGGVGVIPGADGVVTVP